MTEYKLHYWPQLPGRGEFVRLVLEDQGIAYEDVGRLPPEQGGGSMGVAQWMRGKGPGFPVFAPPILEHGALVIAQMPNICRYLGERHGLAPEDPGARAQAMTLMLSIADVVAEVHDTHHPISGSLAYEKQREPAKARSKLFVHTRLPLWLSYFETVLEHGDGEHLVGDAVSYVDLGVQQLMAGLAYAFPRGFARATQKTPRLLACSERVAGRSKLVEYRQSSRCLSFNEDGIFRRYPELDFD